MQFKPSQCILIIYYLCSSSAIHAAARNCLTLCIVFPPNCRINRFILSFTGESQTPVITIPWRTNLYRKVCCNIEHRKRENEVEIELVSRNSNLIPSDRHSRVQMSTWKIASWKKIANAHLPFQPFASLVSSPQTGYNLNTSKFNSPKATTSPLRAIF